MTPTFGSPDSLASLHQLLTSQRGRLAQLHEVHLSPTNEPWKALLGYPFCIKDSLESFLILAPMNRMRDCYVIGRTVLETSITYCYLAAMGLEGVERAWRHAYQKAYRDLSRELRIGKTVLRAEFSGRRPLGDLPDEMQVALEEYTSRRGAEIRQWTPDNLIAQIKIIRERFGRAVGDSLMFAQFAIYRHSSEIAHGSLFGTLWSMGLLEPVARPSSPADIVRRFGEQLAMLYLMLAFCADAVLRVAGTAFPIGALVTASAEDIDRIRQEPWAKDVEIQPDGPEGGDDESERSSDQGC